MSNVLLKMSGSISAYKACEFLSLLIKNGHDVEVVVTPSLLKFIGVATIEGLTGKKVYCDLFEKGRMMSHIELDRWADIVILCPATANSINKLSSGIADDLTTNLFLAHNFTKPYFVVPAMNEKMLLNPVTQASISKLQDMGVSVLPTENGSLACGEQGWGRLLDSKKIYQYVFSKHGPRVLITGGGTIEPIDAVRAITNKSTGHTAATLSDFLSCRGAQVTYLGAQGSKLPKFAKTLKLFSTAESLEDLIKNEVSSEPFDFVIQAAAISDFKVSKSQVGEKISSEENKMIHLEVRDKVISKIKSWSPSTSIVGFKLTANLSKIEQLSKCKKIENLGNTDYVVHNDLRSYSNTKNHVYNIYKKSEFIRENLSLDELCRYLYSIIMKPETKAEEQPCYSH